MVIHRMIEAYWLKLHHFSGSINSDMFNKLQEDQDKLHDSFDLNSFNNFYQKNKIIVGMT